MKEKFLEFAKSQDLYCCYSGKQKTLYVSGENTEQKILRKYGRHFRILFDFDFKIL